MKPIYFITHPDVHIDPQVPVPQWSLSERGIARMKRMLGQAWVRTISSIYSSEETKAIEAAKVLADYLSLAIQQRPTLGENDRSSTGFLKPDEFELVADQFFANPETSIRGWETAQDAQDRIVKAIDQIISEDRTSGSVAVIAHGAVGTLLLCHHAAYKIDRKHDQPGSGGGNYFIFEAASKKIIQGWQAIDDLNA